MHKNKLFRGVVSFPSLPRSVSTLSLSLSLTPFLFLCRTGPSPSPALPSLLSSPRIPRSLPTTLAPILCSDREEVMRGGEEMGMRALEVTGMSGDG